MPSEKQEKSTGFEEKIDLENAVLFCSVYVLVIH
jgi:hypothetical protein